jgi:NADH:ubiquinone oxidoreductase subunit 3 (subunit A)
MLYEFFIVLLVLLVVPNNLVDGMLFRKYIINISKHDNDHKHYCYDCGNDHKKQLLLYNKFKYNNVLN